MVDELLRLDKSSILAVVGKAHLEGMKEEWEKKTGISQDIS
jgi:pheromone shutdown protein TraB